ncbi:MAG TPA: peptidoglycan DD-metalloendopeptidase family protein [Burkholderiales bacterium]
MRSAVALIAVVLLAACAASGRAPVVERGAKSRAAARAAHKPAAPKPAAPARAQAPVQAAEGYYIVQRGDTLYSIALENGADYRELAQWNSLEDPARIKVGQALRVTPPPEARGVQIGRPTLVGRIESRPLEPRRASPAEPARAPEAQSAPAKPVAAAAGASEFIWPVKGKVIAGFSEPRSKGIDIDGRIGDPVVAAAAGRVTYVGSGIPGLGKLVVIRHDNGFITVYAHNREILVKEQQRVAQGQKIAVLGKSDADRPKLHFQIRKGAAAVDPLRYLPAL